MESSADDELPRLVPIPEAHNEFREEEPMVNMFYVMKRGRTPGLYFSWQDYAREVIDFKGVQHKSFRSLIDVEAYLFETLVQ